MWSLARKFLRSADADDAVQEIFIEIWSNAERYDPAIASEATFVSMLARRRLIDRVRRLKRAPGLESLTEASTAPGPPDRGQEIVEVADESERAVAAIGELKPERQEVLRLSIFEGWSHQKISEQLELPLGTVKTHARRGLIQLREKLGVDPPTKNGGDG